MSRAPGSHFKDGLVIFLRIQNIAWGITSAYIEVRKIQSLGRRVVIPYEDVYVFISIPVDAFPDIISGYGIPSRNSGERHCVKEDFFLGELVDILSS